MAGLPTAGGLAGYFSAGTKNSTKNIKPAKMSAFFLLFEAGKELRLYAKTTPNNGANDVPNTVAATIFLLPSGRYDIVIAVQSQ